MATRVGYRYRHNLSGYTYIYLYFGGLLFKWCICQLHPTLPSPRIPRWRTDTGNRYNFAAENDIKAISFVRPAVKSASLQTASGRDSASGLIRTPRISGAQTTRATGNDKRTQTLRSSSLTIRLINGKTAGGSRRVRLTTFWSSSGGRFGPD